MLEKLLVAYFSQQYRDKSEMGLAFELYNKKWKRYARKNKISEKEFELKVKSVLTKVKENESN